MTLRVLSLGAGVQSTTLALMASRGDIEPVECAIFSDTGWEPAAVYRHLDWLETQLRFPVHRVSAGNIRDDVINGHSRQAGQFAAVPWFLKMPDGKIGMGRRECTAHYKLEPIRREVRRLLGVGPRGRVPAGACTMLVGISTDEAQRMKASRVLYVRNVFPLIEAEMSRAACFRYLAERQFPRPPKSACICCPFHSDVAWRALEPEEFADAVAVDRIIRSGGSLRGIRGEQFMHRSALPLDQVDLSTWEERGQSDLFGNECEGMCGV